VGLEYWVPVVVGGGGGADVAPAHLPFQCRRNKENVCEGDDET